MTAPGGPAPENDAWLRRALAVTPNASQTSAKGVDRRVDGQPHFAVRGRGGRFHDPDGREWLDMGMALGSVILGYADPEVERALVEQLRRGTLFSVPATREAEVAEQLLALLPEYGAVRFAKDGSDATGAAVRLARAVTGRDAVVTCGYHGWHDWSTAGRPELGGIPPAVRALTRACAIDAPERIVDALRRAPGRYAAVVIDPATHAPLDAERARALREACARAGTLLVFDEVVSGFRLGLRGYAGHAGVFPDLVCYGKAMANGVPLSALVGGWALMRRLPETGFTTTFGGDCLGLAACAATLRQLAEPGFHARLARRGEGIATAFADAIRGEGMEDRLALRGYATLVRVVSTRGPAEDALVHRALTASFARRGIFWTGGCVLCRDHTDEDARRVAAAFREALRELVPALEARGGALSS